MGFFHTSPKEDSSKPSSLKSFSTDLLYSKRCLVCPLDHAKLQHPKMEPTGKEQTLIYVLGEAPGKTEDEEGRQFVGQSGEILRNSLDEIFGSAFVKNEVRWNNVIRCRPYSGESNRKPLDVEIECCRKFIEEDIEKNKPYAVLGFGAVPLKWILKKYSNIGHWRGRKIPIKIGDHVCWYMPMYHPAFILRKRTKYDDGKNEWQKIFDRDLQELKHILFGRDLPQPTVVEKGYLDGVSYVLGNKKEDLDIVREKLEYFSKFPSIGLDIENNPLKPYTEDPKLACIAISNGEESFGFPLEWPKERSVYKEEAWEDGGLEALELLRDFLLKSGVKVCHNLTHEFEWLNWYFGKSVLFDTEWADTMGKAYVLDERAGSKGEGVLNLDVLCRMYFGFFLKPLSPIDSKNIFNNKIEDTLKYNCLDAKYTYLISTEQDKELDKKLKKVEIEHRYTSRTIALMQEKGLLFDHDKAQEFSKILVDKATAIRNEIRCKKEVLDFKRITQKEFDPNSNKDISFIFGQVMGLKEVKKTTSGAYGTDKDVLDVFAKQGIKLAELLQELRDVNKQKTTYIDGPFSKVSIQGRLRASFNSMFTGTGRLSSQDPNMQNFPKRKNREIRRIIIADKGFWLVPCDYGQLEGRCIAIMSGDVVFCDAIRKGYDVHLEWAKKIVSAYPQVAGVDDIEEMDDWSKMRYRAKNQWVFPLFYGSKQESVGRALDLPKHKCRRLYNEFWETFSGVKKWQERVVDFYNTYGYTETLIGRRRRGALSSNQIINSPVQGTASDIVVMAMNRLSRSSYELDKPQYQNVLNVHDDLTFCIPDESLEEDIEFIAKEMVRPIPDYEDVPLSIDVSIGRNWCDQEGVGSFDSLQFTY